MSKDADITILVRYRRPIGGHKVVARMGIGAGGADVEKTAVAIAENNSRK